MLANARLLHPQLDQHSFCHTLLVSSTHESTSQLLLLFIQELAKNCTGACRQTIKWRNSFAQNIPDTLTRDGNEWMTLHRTTIPQQLRSDFHLRIYRWPHHQPPGNVLLLRSMPPPETVIRSLLLKTIDYDERRRTPRKMRQTNEQHSYSHYHLWLDPLLVLRYRWIRALGEVIAWS